MGNQEAICNCLSSQSNRQVEWFNETLKAMIAKLVNGRQDGQSGN